MKILAIIPARGSSKGIPSKNIQKLGKIPLIAHTINDAMNSTKINRTIVSTDNQKIAKIANKYGAETPFLRPKEFSQNSSSTLDVVQHTIKYLEENENYAPDIVTILLPTSPFRPSNLIDESIKQLKKSNATSVVSVHKTITHPFKAFMLKKEFLKPYKQDYLKYYQRQKLPPFYHTTGAAYTFWLKTLKKYGHYYGPKMKPIIATNDEMSIDIDNEFDFFTAEMVLKYWKNYPKKFKNIL